MNQVNCNSFKGVNRKVRVLFLFATIFWILSCTSNSELSVVQASNPTNDVKPNWIDTPPKQIGASLAHFASGVSSSGDSVAAERQAFDTLSLALSKTLLPGSNGANIESKKELDQVLIQFRRLAGKSLGSTEAAWTLVDRYIQKTESKSSAVFILVSENQSTLNTLKARIATASPSLSGKSEQVRQLESAAAKAESDGDNLVALRLFVNAIRTSSVNNNSQDIERNAQRANLVLNKISFSKIAAPVTIKAGIENNKSIQIQVKGVLEGQEIQIHAGDKQELAQPIDANGLLNWEIPLQKNIGILEASFGLDHSALIEELSTVSSDFLPLVAELSAALRVHSLKINLEVVPAVANLPTVVIVADRNEKNQHVRFSTTSQTILTEEMKSMGFVLTQSKIGPNFMEGKEMDEIVQLTSWAIGGVASTKRFVYGNVRSLGVEEKAGVFTGTASAEIMVVDVASKSIILRLKQNASAEASNRKDAQKNAIATLAKQLVITMANQLP